MITLKRPQVDTKVRWARGGLLIPSPLDAQDRRFKLALRRLGLPPVKDEDKVVLP